MMKIALTGGIGSGKTFVAEIFEILGVPVYYADREAKRLMLGNKELKTEIKSLLGEKSYHKNGRINRTYVSSLVFRDKKLLQSLNAIVHPAVKKDFIIWANNQSFAYVIEESALIFEIGSSDLFDKVIVVSAADSLRIKRVMQRDKISMQAVQDRMANQWPQEKKLQHADYIINNNGDESIILQVYDIHRRILKIKKK